MGAGASVDNTEEFLTEDEVKAWVGDLWDEAQWSLAEKDDQGRVKRSYVLSLKVGENDVAPAPQEGALAAAAQEPTGEAMPPTLAPQSPYKTMRDRHKYRFPELRRQDSVGLENVMIANISNDVEVGEDTDNLGAMPAQNPGIEKIESASAIAPECEISPVMKAAELVFFKLAQLLGSRGDAETITGFGTRYRPVTVNYYRLFKAMDLDHNKIITRGELHASLRRNLDIKESELSDEEIDSMHAAMDEDGSGVVTLAEFARFARGVEPSSYERGLKTIADIGGAIDPKCVKEQLYYQIDHPEQLKRVPSMGDIAAVPGSTAKERANEAPKNLDAAHLVMWHLAQKVGEDAAKSQISGSVYHPAHISYYRMFKRLDLDMNGYITRDEWAIVLRRHIGVGEHVTNEDLNMLFDLMDVNNDGGISLKEFAAFARGSSSSVYARGLAFEFKKLETLATDQMTTLAGIIEG